MHPSVMPKGYVPIPYERSLVGIAEHYEAERYDEYERAIESAARRFGRTEDQVEDDATDVRLFGLGANDLFDCE